MICPNCKKEATEVSETEGHCEHCGIDFEIVGGKAKIKSKGRIRELEENLAETQERLRKVEKDLYGEDESALPFI